MQKLLQQNFSSFLLFLEKNFYDKAVPETKSRTSRGMSDQTPISRGKTVRRFFQRVKKKFDSASLVGE